VTRLGVHFGDLVYILGTCQMGIRHGRPVGQADRLQMLEMVPTDDAQSLGPAEAQRTEASRGPVNSLACKTCRVWQELDLAYVS
jgi:hypothetical protein